MVSKVLTNPQQCIRASSSICPTDSARSAWLLILQSLGIADGKVLLPSYIGITDREGSGIFDPIQSLNLDFEFYSLSERLAADLSSIENIIKSGEIDVLLLVHYFGIEQSDTKKISNLCKQYDVTLVEDCAHVACLNVEGSSLGSYGDYAFYSLHKAIAVQSGGLLRANHDCVLPHVPKSLACDDSVISELLSSDLTKYSEIRKRNYQYYSSILKDVSGLRVMYPHIDDTPHSFPLFIDNGLREKLYFSLFDIDIPTIALYYRLIDEIERDKFPQSYCISNSILNLPLHQDISFEQVEYVCNGIKKKLSELLL
ncbi:DegT/DnrJ/EryC1/StrS family aminotransferase [Agarivorans aestuarii]|uniref:DegT/DnrJ/EryC1/StrS family aminotransferase n=1 Tax=Agarivorans aestuarii TaxID=1563703 RepID=UPI001C7E828C|nr:DegT/DnrJ/EryC1/StrS family aminotransferase [Agarivorans aestuarii]